MAYLHLKTDKAKRVRLSISIKTARNQNIILKGQKTDMKSLHLNEKEQRLYHTHI